MAIRCRLDDRVARTVLGCIKVNLLADGWGTCQSNQCLTDRSSEMCCHFGRQHM